MLRIVFVSPDGRIEMRLVYSSLMLCERGGIRSVPDKTENTLGILRMVLKGVNIYHRYVFMDVLVV